MGSRHHRAAAPGGAATAMSDDPSAAFRYQQGSGSDGAPLVRLRFLGPDGRPLDLWDLVGGGWDELRRVAGRVGADWLHALALTRRVEGGLAVTGIDRAQRRQLLPLTDPDGGVDVEAVARAGKAFGEGPSEEPAAVAALVEALERAGVVLDPTGASPAELRARARALVHGVQGFGPDGATEWRPARDSVLRSDPAHLWLRPALGFAVEDEDSRAVEFCTTHPTPAEVGVLGLDGEWSTSVRAEGRRLALRVGFLLHPRGRTVLLLDPRRPDLVSVVIGPSALVWRVHDADDYREAYLDQRVPRVVDERRVELERSGSIEPPGGASSP